MNATANTPRLKVYTGIHSYRGKFVVKATTWDWSDERIAAFATKEDAKVALAEMLACSAYDELIERLAQHWIEHGRLDQGPDNWEYVKASKPFALDQARHIAKWAVAAFATVKA